jgi:hypothetical protein
MPMRVSLGGPGGLNRGLEMLAPAPLRCSPTQLRALKLGNHACGIERTPPWRCAPICQLGLLVAASSDCVCVHSFGSTVRSLSS